MGDYVQSRPKKVVKAVMMLKCENYPPPDVIFVRSNVAFDFEHFLLKSCQSLFATLLPFLR